MTVNHHVKPYLESIGEGIVGNSTSTFPLSASQAHSVSLEPQPTQLYKLFYTVSIGGWRKSILMYKI